MTDEIAIAEDMIDEAEQHGDVKKLLLDIGELGPVPPEDLAACIERLRPDWEVDWRVERAEARCDCGFLGHPTVLERGEELDLIECPDCGATPEIITGTDTALVKVVVE